MTVTKISDIIVPDVWLPYMLEQTVKNNSLIRSGIVVPDPEMDALAAQGGNLINLPYFKDLTGESEELSDSSDLTPGNITTGQDAARLHMRGKAWGSNDLAAALAGSDPLGAIALRAGLFWSMEEQNMLLASLIGIFNDNSANDSGDLIHTAAAEATGDVKAWNDAAPTVMNPIAIIDGQQLLGDAQDKFSAIMMHSKCFGDLLKQELIDYVQPSGVSTRIPMYLDKEVIVNDNCPTRDGTTSGTVYQSFLFGMGAVARGEGNAPVPVETDRQALSGNDILITRRHFLLHPRGIKWTDSSVAGASPVLFSSSVLADGEIASAANWDRVYEQKNIRIAMIETN